MYKIPDASQISIYMFVFFSLLGGECGSKGVNLIYYKDGRVVFLGSKTSIKCQAGVCLTNTLPFRLIQTYIFGFRLRNKKIHLKIIYMYMNDVSH